MIRCSAARIALASGFLCLAAWRGPDAHARVFHLSPGSLHGATAAGQPGWTLAYEADYRINRGAAHVEALGCSMDPRAALATLEAVYRANGGEAHVFPGETMGWGLAQVGDRVIRLLAVSVARPGECIVFRIEQSVDDFKLSFKPPDLPMLKAIPPPGSGRVTLYAANETSGSEFEIMETDLPPGPQARDMARVAEAAGWSDPLPRSGANGVRILTRGRDVAVWQVRETDDGHTQVVRMLKHGSR